MNIVLSALLKHLRLFFVMSILAASSAYGQQYKIQVKPVDLYQSPSEEAKTILSFYRAEAIEILLLEGKWAKVSFTVKNKPVIGWLEKKHLQLQHDKTAKIESVVPNAAENFLPTSNNAAASVKAINSDLHCIESAKVQGFDGCVIDVDVDISAKASAIFAEVFCEVEFSIEFSDQTIEKRMINKSIRTPLKQGIGAARLQLIALPLTDKKVNKINKLAHNCRIDRVR